MEHQFNILMPQDRSLGATADVQLGIKQLCVRWTSFSYNNVAAVYGHVLILLWKWFHDLQSFTKLFAPHKLCGSSMR